jgi:hypothetical protein
MKRILLMLSLFFVMVLSANAQVLRVTVNSQYDHLALEEQQKLRDLNQSLMDYYNSYAWTEDEYETDIDVTIFIIIETVVDKSYEKLYKAQFQIKSVSGESFYDKEWEFAYQPGYSMDHNKPQFDPLTHFLEFYAYMILAGELDTYEILLGSAFYDKALDLANRGVLSNYSKGWSTRIKELEKITNVRTRPLREAKPDFFEAMYLMETGHIAEAKKFGRKVLDAVEKVLRDQPNNRYLRIFFDAHYRQFAELFRGDADALTRLINYDNSHRETYRDAFE